MSADCICYCGSSKPFAMCCGPIISGRLPAQTPEALMRSRYTAFCIKNIEYLIQTHSPEKLRSGEYAELAQAVEQTCWMGLKIIDAPVPVKTQDHGVVEFAAFYEIKGRLEQLHERSSFILKDGRWMYSGGKMLPPVTLKRNEPCWCGSGKKYKKCHGS